MNMAFVLALGGLSGFILGALAGEHLAIRDMRTEAVKRGAAEWVVDQGTGETTFQWKGETR